jgi:UDP-2,3-diacylglucosamine pyrophosphatase LpxH
VLLRYVVRPTHGMSEGGHDHASALDYLRFGLRLGVRGVLGLGKRFVVAIGALIGDWREHMSEAAQWMRKEHDRKLAQLTQVTKLSLPELRALASLHRRPATSSLFHLLAGVMVDRVTFAVLAVVALAVVLLAPWTWQLGASALVAMALLVPAAWAWRRTRGTIDASDSLRERATQVAALLPTAFVVMGHTHLPEMRAAGRSDRTYVNLGAWAEEEEAALDEASKHPASRTHLVVEVDGDGGGPRAELLRWNADGGPTRYDAG